MKHKSQIGTPNAKRSGPLPFYCFALVLSEEHASCALDAAAQGSADLLSGHADCLTGPFADFTPDVKSAGEPLTY
jgi:hypothetical protein